MGSTSLAVVISLVAIVLLVIVHRYYDRRQKAPGLNTYYEVLRARNIGKKGRNTEDVRGRRGLRKNKTNHRKQKIEVAPKEVEISEEKLPALPEGPEKESDVIPIEKEEDRKKQEPDTGKKEVPHLVNSCSDETDRLEGLSYKRYLEALQEMERDEKPKSTSPAFQEWDSSLAYTSLGKAVHTMTELDAVFQELDQIIESLNQSGKKSAAAAGEDSPKYGRQFKEKLDKVWSAGDSTVLETFDKILEELELPSPSHVVRKTTPGLGESTDLEQEIPAIEIWKKRLGLR